MRSCAAVTWRELAGYFTTPVAYVFIVIFLFLAGLFTFQIGNLFERGQADLQPFFEFHPWLYLCLIPAIAMRLWAQERRDGTIELLLTLPVPLWAAVAGKFLAAWIFTAVALMLTFPVWVSVNVLGSPDNGIIAAGYVGSLLMAGGFLALGSCLSALTRSQVIAFVLSVVAGLLFLLVGFAPVLDFFRSWLPSGVVEAISSMSFLTRFDAIGRGVLDLRDVVYFVSLIAVCLAANTIIVDMKKA